MPRPPVRVLTLLDNVTITGSDPTAFVSEDIYFPRPLNWGPYVFSIRPHTRCTYIVGKIKWRLVMWWSFDGYDWNGPSAITVDMDAVEDLVHIPRFSLGQFGLYMKYGWAMQTTGTAGVTCYAVVSAALSFVFYDEMPRFRRQSPPLDWSRVRTPRQPRNDAIEPSLPFIPTKPEIWIPPPGVFMPQSDTSALATPPAKVRCMPESCCSCCPTGS